MEKKFKMHLSAMGLVGVIFTPIGLIFLIIGIIFAVSSRDDEAIKILKLVFCLLGLVFLVIGGVLLWLNISKNMKQKKLFEAGHYVLASFAGVSENTSVTINGRHPLIAELVYTDPHGIARRFQSKDLMEDPTAALTGKQIPVYVSPEDTEYQEYFVDIDSVL